MLSRRPYSAAEMRRALERKFPDSGEAISDSIVRLREMGYLNDAQYAEQAAMSLARRLGRLRARRQLKSKGVDCRVIEPALQRAYEGVDERQLIEQCIEKKIQAARRPVTRARLASLCQSLLRRGFRADDIMKAVRSKPELRPVADRVPLENMEEERK
jgi:SOS response regulatory protein OraA/RecX